MDEESDEEGHRAKAWKGPGIRASDPGWRSPCVLTERLPPTGTEVQGGTQERPGTILMWIKYPLKTDHAIELFKQP